MSEFVCLKCGAVHTVELCNTVTPPPATSKKVAFVIGHTEVDKGADSPYAVQEWDFWNTVYNLHLSDIGDRFHHDKNISSYTQRQQATAKLTKDYDLVFEMHYNSSSDPAANGAEVLHYFSNQTTKELSNKFLAKYCELTGIKNRGAKAVSSGNGFGFLEAQTPPALLLEPFFGSSKSDIDKWNGAHFRAAILEIL